ncbi:hypothetical protein JZ751_029846 [Albula glossodonta]|uniref:DUF3715 domain-containing protein n=1 Tax=Albula glossodonta TaxID=121402 RepID=A0A8T2NHG5_9TELE|nr:hypothetical protein JZ751_029846 [Albula glossodonta]
MASNTNMERQQGKGTDRRHGGDVPAESCDILKHLLPAAVASSQDGEQAVCEGLASEQEATERRRSGVSEPRHNSSPSAYQRPIDELPRLNFQIPRKNKERKALFQYLSQGSREFQDIVKILSSCYRDASSAGTFTYTKARLVHSELLEKDFIEKRRELKQDGRTDKELVESYCFLLPDPAKLHWICEKGLSVGHARITTLGNPAMGVYLSKYSDLLQINPFDLGATGDIIIFKVMKGKVKSIYENMSKNLLDPTPKFDCHVSKNAARVTSLLSYRAFELTQQYFYEYSFDDIKYRPRHVCPYAVVSFLYKGKEPTPPPKPTVPLRSNCSISEGNKARSSYTVWSGQLLNGGRLVYQIGLRSSTRPFLPFKLPEKLEIGTVMNLDQVKRKIPAVLFSWDTYSGTREVLKSGMYCSLFEVVDKSKHGNSLSALLHKLERERMVRLPSYWPFVCPEQRGLNVFTAQMVNPNDVMVFFGLCVAERRGGWTRCLQALFVFQESRGPLQPDSQQPPIMPQLDTFVPALHYALMKVRSNPPVDLGAGVERQARDYLSSRDEGKVRQYYMNEYKQNLDEREKLHAAPKQRHNLEGYLRSYIYRPNVYLLAVVQAREMVESLRRAPEYSPVSDWEGSDGQGHPPEHKHGGAAAAGGAQAQANGAHGAPLSQADNDPEKMRELLKLIHMWKRNEGEARQVGAGAGVGVATGEGQGEAAWETRGLKRKLEEETAANTFKYLRRTSLDNGEHVRDDEGQSPPSLSAVMNCMGIRDTDLRKDKSRSATRLMEMLATFNKARKSSGVGPPDGPASPEVGGGARTGEGHELADVPRYDTMIKLGLPARCDIDLRNRGDDEEGQDDQDRADYLEEQTAGSMSSLEVFSPCSSNEQHRGTELLGEGQMPWFLIPITGIKSEKYCLREEDDPKDPRFLQAPAGPNYTPLEKSHNSLSEALEDSYMGMGGGGQAEMDDEGVEEVVRDGCLGEGSAPPLLRGQEGPPSAVDSIIDEALGHFSAEMHGILREEQVYYRPAGSELGAMAPPVGQRQQQDLWAPGMAFSEYISHYNSPVHIQSYVTTLCERMSHLIHPEPTPTPVDADPLLPSPAHALIVPGPPPVPIAAHSLVSVSASASVHTPVPVSVSAPVAQSHAHLGPTSAPSPALEPAPSSSPCPANPRASPHHRQPTHSLPRPGSAKEGLPQALKPLQPQLQQGQHRKSSRQEGGAVPGARTTGSVEPVSVVMAAEAAPVPALDPTPGSGPTSISSLISQLKPEVFSSLVEIIKDVQKNAVKFYIHSQEQESNVCQEIKEYLMRLGNVECDPQAFLESKNNLDKLLIIIQNEDIAAHVHKIPALVSLKKLPSVSFAGVDSLDDVKNHTYNELFVSGGFIVSDEFVLNPDFITHGRTDDVAVSRFSLFHTERLHAFLKFLEEQKTPESLWQWKVHCKTQKKLKELGRFHEPPLGWSQPHSAVRVAKPPDLVGRLRRVHRVHRRGGVDRKVGTRTRTPGFNMWEIRLLGWLSCLVSPLLNSDALSLLNLLTTYQKRHLVEFLPYHECDAPSRPAPDLDCLVRLQAHHTQHRHIIFLTERRFEMFPHYSSNGIVIASIDDIMNSFPSLIGFHDIKQEPLTTLDNHPPPVPPTGAADTCRRCAPQDLQPMPKDECVEEEDMSLDSEDDSPVIEEPVAQLQDPTLPPPLPKSQEFRPPLPNQDQPEVPTSSTHMPLDFEALKSAISQFKASAGLQRPPVDFEVGGGSSPGEFGVNPHQSFLCPSSLRPPYPATSIGYVGPAMVAFPGSPCGMSQESSVALPLGHQLSLAQEEALPAVTLSPHPLPPFSLCASQDRTSCDANATGNTNANAMPGAASSTSLSHQGQGAMATTCYLGMGVAGDTGQGQLTGWGHLGGVSSACGTPTSQDDGATLALGPTLEAHPPANRGGITPTPGSGNSASGTPNSQGGGTTPSSVTVTQGGAKTGTNNTTSGGGGGGSTPSSQGSLTPGPPGKPAEKASTARGGALLPLPRPHPLPHPHPQGPGSVNGRGRGTGGPPQFDVGNRAGAVAMGYRGLPPSRPRPRGCRERGGACVRGYPHGRGRGVPQGGGYYTDFTQDTYISWGDEYAPQGDTFHTHRDGYNGW